MVSYQQLVQNRLMAVVTVRHPRFLQMHVVHHHGPYKEITKEERTKIMAFYKHKYDGCEVYIDTQVLGRAFIENDKVAVIQGEWATTTRRKEFKIEGEEKYDGTDDSDKSAD